MPPVVVLGLGIAIGLYCLVVLGYAIWMLDK
jgi:hypothetical protein